MIFGKSSQVLRKGAPTLHLEMKTDQGGASWPFCPGCCRSLKASLISWLKLELLVAGFGRREATTSTSFCLPQICSPLPAMQLDWWLVPGTGEASQDQGCPAAVWSRDTTRDVHVGDPSPLLPALLRWSGARAAPLAGGKRTLNLMKLQRRWFCSAVPPTAVPAALPATRARALPWWMLSGPVSRAQCWLSTKTTTTTTQLLSVSDFLAITEGEACDRYPSTQ